MALAINNISVTFGDKTILDRLSLPVINAGEMVAIIGKNGAGKSTLLRHITQDLRQHSQQILLHDKPLTLDSIGYLPQDHRISATITVVELLITTLNMRSHSLFAKANSAEKSLQLLEQMGILHLANKVCTELSGGESQMVGLAQAVVNQPKVLILDEPTSALDMHNQMKLLDFVRLYAQENQACVLMVIHDLNLAIQYSTKVAALHQGQLFAYGNPITTITPPLILSVFDVDSHVAIIDERPIVVVKSARNANSNKP
ncbi:iron ABC transporter [Photobacterium kishitanii]|uniref:ABC transporter ATP-binding protein n=1 Tax=Photobacterium kishitanii TaxID=318456 RepID=A0AAX0Z0T0_9GAMM|nr:ABC transporter ATP-binding protein [Photobacterium kishitanii]KJG09717.1 iron ABC transporter [Photobacterium kishitanii]KJG57934.1 iron ABC transporter [Photobacterium kishitanii]KJG61510.1 iron ABC transporter [Photobacterium kishitanii]KJG66321.1 iron ABC transporter [Photobacterium kishitanii]KJG69595.1 iron ABC transporter [Photobacterium kishitanii]